VIDVSDRFVFISQYFDHDLETKVTKPVQVNLFPKKSSVTADVLFEAIIENINYDLLSYVYSIMADTTAVNTGKKTDVNKRLENTLCLKLDMQYTLLNAFST